MRTYIAECQMVDGRSCTATSKHRTESLSEYADWLTSSPFTTFINDDGTIAHVLNLQNVMSMKITYEEEVE